MIDGYIDLSSNEPHITVHCPICYKEWMQKVDDMDHISKCDCKLSYKMEKGEGNIVDVTFTIPKT